MQVYSGVGASLLGDTWIQKSIPWNMEESLLGRIFYNKQNLQAVKCVVWGFHYEKIALLKPGSFQWMLAFISCGSKEAGIRCMGSPIVISKFENLWTPKGVDLRFRRTNSNANGQGIWRVSINFAHWVLMMWLVRQLVALGRLIREIELSGALKFITVHLPMDCFFVLFFFL